MGNFVKELQARKANKLHLAFAGALVGVVVGFVVIVFRMAIEFFQEFMEAQFNLAKYNINSLFILIAIYGLAISFSTWLVRRQPMISGSGIPQVAGSMIGKLKFDWLKVMLAKLLGGFISLGSGLTLGREGPSVQIGASCGAIISKLFKRPISEQRYYISSGAASGIAAAFSAPLSGTVFALEEVHRNFSPLAMISAMSGAVVADFIAKKFFGVRPELSIPNIIPLPLKHYWIVILLSLLVAASSILFIKSILYMKKIFAGLKLPLFWRMALPFILTLIVIYIDGDFFGAGQKFISLPVFANKPWYELFLIYFIKLFLLVVAFASGLPGGIFFPLLVLGSLVGNIFGSLLAEWGLLDSKYILFIAVIAMAGHFTGIVRAPITGIVLICEMTGTFAYFLPLVIVAALVYVLVEWWGTEPIYESLLDILLKQKHKDDPQYEEAHLNKGLLLEYAVHHGSVVDGVAIADIEWPETLLLVAIKRGGRELLPRGGTTIYGGDYLVVMLTQSSRVNLDKLLHEYCD